MCYAGFVCTVVVLEALYQCKKKFILYISNKPLWKEKFIAVAIKLLFVHDYTTLQLYYKLDISMRS